MAITGVTSQTDTNADILFKTYQYKDGKGQETVYYKKDCVELSLESFHVEIGSETYEDVKNSLKSLNKYHVLLPNNLFNESYDVMEDYYNGKLNAEEVKQVFKEYFYHSMGGTKADYGNDADGVYQKQRVTAALSGLYEYFSRANTRNAVAQNNNERKELMEKSGLSYSDSYYNADWYYACDDMQKMFQATADELADEFGAQRVDYAKVAKETRFTLDGGITYNGVLEYKNQSGGILKDE